MGVMDPDFLEGTSPYSTEMQGNAFFVIDIYRHGDFHAIFNSRMKLEIILSLLQVWPCAENDS